ncbi:DUF2510 domain-containing protein [Uniformispora flossi]|uniref:DUF2510 domain-containing protein n=1 Tax=Uniformispora flossi TaxID=3390723 RepID=UPI003C2C5127
MTASIPPGWYDDPSAPGMERWWDGTQWTESSRPRADAPGVPPAPGGPSSGPVGPAGPAGPMGQPGFGPANGPGGLAGPGQAPYPPQYGSYPPAAGGSRKNRNLIIGLVALLVVGGLVAVLVFTLGGKDDKSSVATDGTLTDTTTGVTIPFIKGWDKDTDKDRPAHQTKDKVACSDESGSASSDPSDGPSPDSSDSDSSSDCYLGEAEVAYVPGKSFDGAVSRMQGQIKNGDDFKVTKTVREDKTKIDGKNAQVLVYEVEENKGSPARTATLEFIIIDNKFEYEGDDAYPIVFVGVDHDPKAPSKGVLDTVRDGIKVGTPQPSASSS